MSSPCKAPISPACTSAPKPSLSVALSSLGVMRPVELRHLVEALLEVASLGRELVEVGNASSLHTSGRRARRVVEESRETVALAFGDPSALAKTTQSVRERAHALKRRVTPFIWSSIPLIDEGERSRDPVAQAAHAR